jgi:glutamine---fructose-6-phosphate transaminase (isomerizing)
MEKTPYLEDILGEPQALHDVMNGFDPQLLSGLAKDLAQGRFDRIVITGMGASTFGTYPAWLTLVRAGLPAHWVETGELLYSFPQLITPRTLLWIISNSGKSKEVNRLVEKLPSDDTFFLLANTNNQESPLAKRANLCLPLYTGNDLTVSSRSYIGTVAVCQLMALVISGQSTAQAMEDLRLTTFGIEEYLAKWEAHLQDIVQKARKVERMIILGRGSSYATALEGSLLIIEATKLQSEGLTTGQFWHGPLEDLDATFTVVVTHGDTSASEMDKEMVPRLLETGANVLWLNPQAHPTLTSLPTPAGQGIGLPIAEIIPLQLLVLDLAQKNGFPPGVFRYLYKIVNTRD